MMDKCNDCPVQGQEERIKALECTVKTQGNVLGCLVTNKVDTTDFHEVVLKVNLLSEDMALVKHQLPNISTKLDKIVDTKAEIHHYVDESRIEIAESRGEVAEVRGELKVVSDNVNILLEKVMNNGTPLQSLVNKMSKKTVNTVVIIVVIAVVALTIFVGYKVNKVVNSVTDATALIQSVKGE